MMKAESPVMDTQRDRGSKKLLWTGRALSALVCVALLMDAAMKIFQTAPAMQGTVQAGYPAATVLPIGVILLVCVICYALPQTCFLGAILLTGYLGGAVATNVRLSTPLFSYILAPVYVGVLAWAGLFLRDERLRALVPLRKNIS